MYCSNCGSKSKVGDSFCSKCGESLNVKSISNAKPEEDLLKCPKCASTQLSVQKKGFSTGKAVTGALLTGGIGILAGTIGSNSTKIHCLKCGKKFNAGEDWESEKIKIDKLFEKDIQESQNGLERNTDNFEKSINLVGKIIFILVFIFLMVFFQTC